MGNRDATGRPSAGTDRSQRPGQRGDDRGELGRRGLLVGAGGLAALLGGGWFFLLRDREGPDDVAEEFVVTLDAGEFDAADDLIHPESPLDGAGQAAELFVAVAGVGDAIDALDISVLDTEVIEEGDGEAVVAVTTEIDFIVDEATVDVPLEMRTADGDWYVWQVGG